MATRETFTYMNTAFSSNSELSDRDVVLFNYILAVTGGGRNEFYQSLKTISENCFPWVKTGRSIETSVSKSLKKLCDVGYIQMVKSNKRSISVYIVNTDELNLRIELCRETSTHKVELPTHKSMPTHKKESTHKSMHDLRINYDESTHKLQQNYAQNYATIYSPSHILKNSLKYSETDQEKIDPPQPELQPPLPSPAKLTEDLPATLPPLTDRPTDFLEKKESEPQELQPDYSRPEYAGLSTREIRARERGRLALIAERKEWAQEQKSKQIPSQAEKSHPATQVPVAEQTQRSGQINGLKNDSEVGSLVGIGAILKNFSFSS